MAWKIIPLIKRMSRDDAAAFFHRVAPGRSRGDRFGPCVDCREPFHLLKSFREERHQTPASQDHLAFACFSALQNNRLKGRRGPCCNQRPASAVLKDSDSRVEVFRDFCLLPRRTYRPHMLSSSEASEAESQRPIQRFGERSPLPPERAGEKQPAHSSATPPARRPPQHPKAISCAAH